MIINNAINSPLPTSLAQGGTGASLTPSDGGIFYSTSNSAAILDGTSTGKQILMSGALGAPSWSTATYPDSSFANQLFYSSSDNVIARLPSQNSAGMFSNVLQVRGWLFPINDGQIVVGKTLGTPQVTNLMAGSNIAIDNSPGNITINQIPNFQWIATQTASNSPTLSFNNNLSQNYQAYRIVLINLLLENGGDQLYLQFGTGTAPTYLTTGYIYQIFNINNDGSNPSYEGFSGSYFNQEMLTSADEAGGSNDPTYGGISGTIDLYVTSGSSVTGNGISHMSYMSNALTVNYCNTTCAFQIRPGNFTSVQLFMSTGNIVSGSAYLYGITI